MRTQTRSTRATSSRVRLRGRLLVLPLGCVEEWGCGASHVDLGQGWGLGLGLLLYGRW